MYSNGLSFLDVKQNGAVFIDTITVDNQTLPNLILMKGSNLIQDWSLKGDDVKRIVIEAKRLGVTEKFVREP